MFHIKTVTGPTSEPVTTAELKAYLRLNTTDEDSLLASYIATARHQFEHLTQRAVISQTLRQWNDSIHHGFRIMRGDVLSISAVKYYNTSGALTTDTTFSTDLNVAPVKVFWVTKLTTSTTRTPVAYVDFVAGFSTVPEDVKTAIKLLAGMYFDQRAAFITDNLKELPMGFQAICAKYDLGFRFDNWGN